MADFGHKKKQLIVELYDHAIRSLSTAAEAVRTGDRQGYADAIEVATMVVVELDSAVDATSGIEVADSLHRIYQFILERISDTGTAHDAQVLGEIVGILEELNQSWKIITC